ncbi:MAG: PepSY domain-containing protein [Kiloniellaceae bacterium]
MTRIRRTHFRRYACAAALGASLALSAAARAAEEDEQSVRQAIEAGQITPLQDLMARIRREFPGRILKMALQRERFGNRPLWVYEAKVLTPEGNVLKLVYDARTTELLALKGRHGEDWRVDEED